MVYAVVDSTLPRRRAPPGPQKHKGPVAAFFELGVELRPTVSTRMTLSTLVDVSRRGQTTCPRTEPRPHRLTRAEPPSTMGHLFPARPPLHQYTGAHHLLQLVREHSQRVVSPEGSASGNPIVSALPLTPKSALNHGLSITIRVSMVFPDRNKPRTLKHCTPPRKITRCSAGDAPVTCDRCQHRAPGPQGRVYVPHVVAVHLRFETTWGTA
jgi:hypothetical protein